MSPPNPADVLLVEDNPGDVRLTREAFETAGIDATFAVATDGDEAVTYLFERRDDEDALPDIVLLDLNLPRMDGFAVLDEIRSDSNLAHLPVLVLSSSEATEDVADSYDRCANAYLTKPANPDQFVTLASAVEEFWFDRARLPPVPA